MAYFFSPRQTGSGHDNFIKNSLRENYGMKQTRNQIKMANDCQIDERRGIADDDHASYFLERNEVNLQIIGHRHFPFGEHLLKLQAI